MRVGNGKNVGSWELGVGRPFIHVELTFVGAVTTISIDNIVSA
jgi:hypothetical protein